MSDNLHKFLFLGVVLALAVLGSRKPAAPEAANLLAGDSRARNIGEAPVFVLQAAPQISAESLPGETGQTSGEASGNEYGSTAARISEEIISGYQASSSPPGGQNYGQTGSGPNSGGATVNSDADFLQPLFYRYGNDPPPEIGARAALVADMKNGEVYFGLKPDMRWPLASVTKLMSAAVISQNIPLNQSTTLSAADAPSDMSGTDLGAGNRYDIGDLRLAMLTESNNEAALAVANFYGYARFVAAMNAKAKEWGLGDTNFDGPIGLSAANQSTATDLLAISRRVYADYPEIFRITRTKSVYITELNSGKKILLGNINLFAGRPDFLGGKTGYTDESSGNLLSVFSYKRQPILVIVLGTEDRFGDTEKLLNWFKNNYK